MRLDHACLSTRAAQLAGHSLLIISNFFFFFCCWDTIAQRLSFSKTLDSSSSSQTKILMRKFQRKKHIFKCINIIMKDNAEDKRGMLTKVLD